MSSLAPEAAREGGHAGEVAGGVGCLRALAALRVQDPQGGARLVVEEQQGVRLVNPLLAQREVRARAIAHERDGERR